MSARQARGSGEGAGPLPQYPSLLPVAVTAAAILAVAGLVAAIPPLREAVGNAVSGDTDSLRSELDGAAGVVLLLVLALIHAVVFYPAEILDAAAGFVWGLPLGLTLVMVGWLLNAYVAWEIGRHGARPLLYRLFGQIRFLRYQAMIERGGILLLLAVRLIPIVPYSLFSIVAGAAHVPLWRLLWTSAVGYLPITALFVYLGSRLEELSPADPILIGGGVALIAALYLAHLLQKRLVERPTEE